MSDFMQQALQRSPNAPDWLDQRRESGRAQWQTSPWPNRKTEAWKYTSLRELEEGKYLGAPPQTKAYGDLESSYRIPEMDACKLVFVNGCFVPELSAHEMPAGVELVRFSQADKAQAQEISSYLGQAAVTAQPLFAALNDAWLAEGVFLRVAANTMVKPILQIVWMTTAGEDNFSFAQRLLLVMQQGSSAKIVEHFTSSAETQNAFCNGVTEIILQDNAELQHYRLHLEQEQALHIGSAYVRLARGSRLNSFHLALGGKLKRIDLVIDHRGEGAQCTLNGVYLARHRQHVDYHSCIEHSVPHCTTDEVFRGIIGDRAKAVFNGRIHIHPKAQKTLARLSNKNLLTSAEAEVDTKPELEIYADDVQCAHGATVAQLDETALYYLRARGISRAEAEVTMRFAFINELLNRINERAISQYLRPLLVQYFERAEHLVRHIG